MFKTKAQIHEAAITAKKKLHNFISEKAPKFLPEDGILDNARGGILDVALDVAIGVVCAAVILVAMKQLFNVDLLPSVTSKIQGLFS